MMLSNNKGISLVILIIAMTLIAILGASFVSLVGSKHRGFLYQRDSYRALNIANAGVEYAIRHISDDLGDATSTYFRNLSTSDDISIINFVGGTFSITRDFSADNIEVTGLYPIPTPVSTRIVRLSNFRNYLKTITLVSDPAQTFDQRKPRQIYPTIVIPIMKNGANVTIRKIRIELTNNLNTLYLQSIGVDSINNSFTDIELPASQDFTLGTPVLISSNLPITVTILFKDVPGMSLNGNYTVKFYDSLTVGASDIGSISFPMPPIS